MNLERTTSRSMIFPCVIAALAATMPFGARTSPAQGPTFAKPEIPADAGEAFLIENIKRLTAEDSDENRPAPSVEKKLKKQAEALAYIDALLARFPESNFREEAMILRLSCLASLARVSNEHLDKLLSQTSTISEQPPSGRLASENAYYAIQAFVLGARRENMPPERRLAGGMERYEAFLADYPNSPHRPVVWASLIRNALALNKTDRAEAELNRMEKEFPDHAATRRAIGEVHRATAVGKPFNFQYTAPDGAMIRGEEFKGRVLILHFWATWNERSVKELADVVKLHERWKERGLALIGINVDKGYKPVVETARSLGVTWPQYYDGKGLENSILVGAGVIEVPTYLVVDRKGILRGIESIESLGKLVESLLNEPGEMETESAEKKP